MKSNEEVIKVIVTDLSDLFHPFDNDDISDELASYIEKRCSNTHRYDLVIKIFTDKELTKEMKIKIINAIRSHYGLDVRYTELSNKNMKYLNVIYFIIGFMMIFGLRAMNIDLSFTYILDIIGSLMIWESVYKLIFMNSEMDQQIILDKKIMNAKIVFEKRD